MSRTLLRFHGLIAGIATLFVALYSTTSTLTAQTTRIRIITESDRKSRADVPNLSSGAPVTALDVDLTTLRQIEGPVLNLAAVPVAPGIHLDLDLTEYTILSPDVTLITTGDDGVRPMRPLTARLYRGAVAGDPSSSVYLSISETDLVGLISVGGTSYQLQSDHTAPKVANLLAGLSYSTSDVHSSMMSCGVNDSNEGILGGNRVSKEKYLALLQGTVPITVSFMVEGAYEGDYEFRQLFKDDPDPDVAAADYMLQIVGQASAIYERDMNCQLRIGYMNIYTSAAASPYKESSSMQLALYQERDFWRANRGNVQRAYVHVMSGKSWTNPIGIAFLSVLCNPDQAFAYSLTTRLGTEQDVVVVSHENGHIFGSVHTHSCQWNPAIDSCAAAENGSCFGSANVHESRGTIMSYCAAKDLSFHPKCAQVIRNGLASAGAPCVLPGKKLEIGPHLTVLPKVNVNVDRDTLIVDFFRNPSVSPVEVQELRITGVNSERFSIVEGEPPFTLGPGETKDLKVRYNSPVEEPSFGTFTAIHDGYNPPPSVYFEAYAVDPRPDLGVRVHPINHDINFGTVALGEFIDTAMARIFYNAGTATVVVDSSWIGGPDAFDFRMTEGNAPFEIPTGSISRNARFVFQPRDTGQKVAWLFLRHNSRTRKLDSIPLRGYAKRGPLLVLSISNLTVNFGERAKGVSYDTAFPGFFYNAGSDTLGLAVDLYGESQSSFTSTVSGISEMAPGDQLGLQIGLFDNTDGIKRAYLLLGHIRFDTLGNDKVYRQDTVWLIALVGQWASAPGDGYTSKGIYISPNPTNGPITAVIDPMEGESGHDVTITLIDMRGREVDRLRRQFGSGSMLLQIATEDIPSDAYHLCIRTDRGSRYARVTVTR